MYVAKELRVFRRSQHEGLCCLSTSTTGLRPRGRGLPSMLRSLTLGISDVAVSDKVTIGRDVPNAATCYGIRSRQISREQYRLEVMSTSCLNVVCVGLGHMRIRRHPRMVTSRMLKQGAGHELNAGDVLELLEVERTCDCPRSGACRCPGSTEKLRTVAQWRFERSPTAGADPVTAISLRPDATAVEPAPPPAAPPHAPCAELSVNDPHQVHRDGARGDISQTLGTGLADVQSSGRTPALNAWLREARAALGELRELMPSTLPPLAEAKLSQ